MGITDSHVASLLGMTGQIFFCHCEGRRPVAIRLPHGIIKAPGRKTPVRGVMSDHAVPPCFAAQGGLRCAGNGARSVPPCSGGRLRGQYRRASPPAHTSRRLSWGRMSRPFSLLSRLLDNVPYCTRAKQFCQGGDYLCYSLMIQLLDPRHLRIDFPDSIANTVSNFIRH